MTYPFSKGDQVKLLVGGHHVGNGTVMKILETDSIHSMPLGEGRIGVLVESSIYNSTRLPVPTTTNQFLSDTIDSYVIWYNYDACLSSLPNPKGICIGSCSNFVPPCHKETEVNDVNLQVDDVVDMLVSSQIVCRGIIFNVSPSAYCHNRLLGPGRISAKVIEVFDGGVALPHQHDGADTIDEAMGSIVVWDIGQVKKVSSHDGKSRLETLSTRESHVESLPTQDSGAQPNDEMGNDMNPCTNVEKSAETRYLEISIATKDYSKRFNWMGETVHLYSLDKSSKIASGFLTVPYAASAVNDEVLGDDHVGVVVVSSFSSTGVPDFIEGVPKVMKWHVHAVMLDKNGRFLGDILDEAHTQAETEAPMVMDTEETHGVMPEKRPYNYIRRKKLDLEEKRRKQLNTKAAKKTTEDSVDELLSQNCCNSKCCKNMSTDDVKEIRGEFYGMSADHKTTHIYNLFHSREIDLVKSGMFVLKGRRVCREAFAKIHDFSMTTFYNYKRGFEDGYKVGYHGNQGLLKTRENTMIATAHLQAILNMNAEPMPHLIFSSDNGTDGIHYRLPSCWTKKDIFQEIALSMEIDGHCPVTAPTLYKIWDTKFANFGFHKESAFAKCTLCTRLKEALSVERRKDERATLEKTRGAHLREQMSRRHVYYAHRILAKKDPNNYLCIIHDKMDQAKTWIPRLKILPKSLSNVGIALPIALTGMLTHGRDPGAYAHFSLSGLWPGDSDFTITSIARCLRDLETYTGDLSGDITNSENVIFQRPIFKSLLDQSTFEQTYLLPNKISLERF
jgi:hypothetical protein